MKLTPNKAQIENLEYVRDHGRAKPRSASGYWCRKNNFSEFVCLFEDGVVAATSEKEPSEGAWIVKIVGEQLTDLGRSALTQTDGEGKPK